MKKDVREDDVCFFFSVLDMMMMMMMMLFGDDARFSARCALKSLSSFLCSTALTC